MTGIDKLLENYKESLSGDEDTGKFNELNKKLGRIQDGLPGQ